MRRADRLFEIVQALRGDRVTTAAALADRFEVSVRTIYRDVADLQKSGVPIDGEAGVGYLLRPGFQLPPLMFTLSEIEALVVGARMVKAWAGRQLAAAASEALIKIGAVVPGERLRAAERVAIYAPGVVFDDVLRDRLDALADAIRDRMRIRFIYTTAEQTESERTVRPLSLQFWGGVWTLAAWCELRRDFRSFRLDRMTDFEPTGEVFLIEKGKTFEDLMKRIAAGE